MTTTTRARYLSSAQMAWNLRRGYAVIFEGEYWVTRDGDAREYTWAPPSLTRDGELVSGRFELVPLWIESHRASTGCTAENTCAACARKELT